MAHVAFDPGIVRVSDLHRAIEEAGYRTGLNTLRLRVKGVYCAACVPQIEQALRETPGVATASLNPATEEVHVAYDPRRSDLKHIRGPSSEQGMRPSRRPRLPHPNPRPTERQSW